MVRFVLVTLIEALPANLSSIRRFYILTDLRSAKKSDFSLLVRETSNCAFCISYPDGSLTFKFELNTTILDCDRFEVSKNPIFRNSSRRPQMVRFMLLTLKAA